MRGRSSIWSVVAALLFAATCTDANPPPASPAPQEPSAVAQAPPSDSSPGPSPGETIASQPKPLRLDADLADAPAKWRLVAFVPFGGGRAQLGYVPPAQSAPLGPNSFAVDGDGTFWILDTAKSRLVHIDRDGTFLNAVGVDTDLPMRDLAILGSGKRVLLDEKRGVIGEVVPGAKPITTKVRFDGRQLSVSGILGIGGTLFVEGQGYPGKGGPRGFGTVGSDHPGSFRPAPGLPVFPRAAGGAVTGWLDVTGSGKRFTVIRTPADGGTRTEQPLTLELVDGHRRIRSLASVVLEASSRGGIACYVRIASAAGGEGGAWYLWLPAAGGKPVWERLPGNALNSEQSRYLAAGPDGAVYLMRYVENGIEILRG